MPSPFIPPLPEEILSRSQQAHRARDASNAQWAPNHGTTSFHPNQYTDWNAIQDRGADPYNGASGEWAGYGQAPVTQFPQGASGYHAAPQAYEGFSRDWVGFAPPGRSRTPHPTTGWSATTLLPSTWNRSRSEPGTIGTGFVPLPPMNNGAFPPWNRPGHIYPNYGAQDFGFDGEVEKDTVTGAIRRKREMRMRREEGEIDTRFMIGYSYGPVLDPIQVSAVHARLQLNPLLTPPPDSASDSSTHDYLKWNMLFPSKYAQRSGDPPRHSWSKGRREPATFPRVSSLKLVLRNTHTPWIIDIKANDLKAGVTCADVIDQLSDFLYSSVWKSEYEAFSEDARRKIQVAYHHHRSRNDDVPGGRMDSGLLRADFLTNESIFMGLEMDEDLIKEKFSLTTKKLFYCTFVVKCAKRMSTAEDAIPKIVVEDVGSDSKRHSRQ